MTRRVGTMTGRSGILVGLVALAITCCTWAHSIPESPRQSQSQNTEDGPDSALDYPDYEQRMMPKRSALLLDRMFVALQKALENDEIGKEGYKSLVRTYPYYSDLSDSPGMGLSDEKTMDLQRRGQAKGRVYWRCYFNAVSCFKKK